MKYVLWFALFFLVAPVLAKDSTLEQFVLKVYSLDSVYAAGFKLAFPDGFPPDYDFKKFKDTVSAIYNKFLCDSALMIFTQSLQNNSMMGESCDAPLFIPKPENFHLARSVRSDDGLSAEVIVIGASCDTLNALENFQLSDLSAIYESRNIKSPPYNDAYQALVKKARDYGNYGLIIKRGVVDRIYLKKTGGKWKVKNFNRNYEESIVVI